jgi:lipid-binding SYLF domain-containing protein
MNRVTVTACAALTAAAFAPPAASVADAGRQLSEAARIVEQTRSGIRSEDWQRARCVAVMPAGLAPGREPAHGVVSCRSGDGWSAPLFVQLAKGSWRGLARPDTPADLVLLVVSQAGVEKLLRDSLPLGPGGSDVVAYMGAEGSLAEVAVTGGVLQPDGAANVGVYGRGAVPRTVLATRELSAPTSATPFLRALGGRTASTASTASTPAEPVSQAVRGAVEPDSRPSSCSITDDELRTRLLDTEHVVDRLLADAADTPVGTSGRDENRRAGAITVDRTRLVQVRQQLEALLVKLNRR